jgi:protoporphyrin/coproporphyrin ferrochelatase
MTPYNAYRGQANYQHNTSALTGVLFANLGTPDAPTTPAVRRYLREFFADPRVFEFRPVVWRLLSALILRVRPRRSAQLYQKIWQADGSPLLRIAEKQVSALEAELSQRSGQPVKVALGMRYGNPSIDFALEQLRLANVRRLVVLPAYPQYSATTTASTFDAVSDSLKQWRWLPDLRLITHYHDDEAYIAALVNKTRAFWAAHGQPEKLLFSFHGLPKRYFLAGDPYYCECMKTARLVAEGLGLEKERWFVAFQSLFGREEWLRPYTSETLEAWGQAKLGSLHVITPGFSADCLETLEEIAEENREVFQHAGGGSYHYIPALNDDPAHISALADVVIAHAEGWLNSAEVSQLRATSGLARA